MNRDAFMCLPDGVRLLVEGETFTEDEIGMSGSRVLLFADKVLKMELYREETDKAVQVMRWLEGKLPVPRVLAYEVKDGRSYLLMSRMEGHMACDEAQMERRDELHTLLAEGLKAFWNTPVEGCPRKRTFEDDLKKARYRVEHDEIEEFYSDAFEEEPFQSPMDMLEYLEQHVPPFEGVMSHGDYCLPNVLIKDGKVSGFIDLGGAAIADRYADIADCYRSLKGNYLGWFDTKVYADYDPEDFLRALGMPIDREKLRFMLLLNNLL